MPEILRRDSRPALPWKNGGGVTREVAAFPAGGDLTSFDWRVSIAEVRAAGPFSRFAGVDRRMAVLEGRLALSVDAQPQAMLAPDSPPVFFPGDAPAYAEPIDGPVVDLNVMTRRGCFESTMRRYTLSEALEPGPEQGTWLLLALSDLILRGTGPEVRLARFDAARIEAGPWRCGIMQTPAPAASFTSRLARDLSAAWIRAGASHQRQGR
jgi:environmental stress-induced protein Ves